MHDGMGRVEVWAGTVGARRHVGAVGAEGGARRQRGRDQLRTEQSQAGRKPGERKERKKERRKKWVVG